LDRAVGLAWRLCMPKDEGGDFVVGPTGVLGGASDGVAEHADEATGVADGVEGAQACRIGRQEGEGGQRRGRGIGGEAVSHGGGGFERRDGVLPPADWRWAEGGLEAAGQR
jgi:hypothetical protein